MLWRSEISAPRSATVASRSDTGPYAALEASLFPIHKRFGWENVLLAEYPQRYEPRIVLHLPMKIATLGEYRAASDTERAGHWWLDTNGMTIEGRQASSVGITHEFNKRTPVLRSRIIYSFFPSYGFDDSGNIYIMPENERVIRKYGSDGTYLRTIRPRSPEYAAWKQIISDTLCGGCRDFQIRDEWTGVNSQSRRIIINLREIGGPQSRVTLNEDLVARRTAREQSMWHESHFFYMRDSDYAIYAVAHVAEDLLQYHSANDLTLLGGDGTTLARPFLLKYDKSGRLLAETELLPSYTYYPDWIIGGHSHVKFVNGSIFYFIGIDYLSKSMDLFVLRYERTK